MKSYKAIYVWELPLRIAHWTLAIAIITLFATGLYISNPVFPATSDEAFHAFFMGTVRYIHFIAGFVLIGWFIVRTYWNVAGNKYARFAPFKAAWWNDLKHSISHYLFIRKHSSGNLGHNALAELGYFIFAWLGALSMSITGLTLLSEVNPEGMLGKLCAPLIALFGGSLPIRYIHHVNAWLFIVFIVIHLYMVLRDDIKEPKGEISSMINGYKFQEKQ